MEGRTPTGFDARIQSVIDWLIDGAPTARLPQELLMQGCGRLVEAGIPLHRVAVFVRTLHPDLMGRRFLWRAGQDVSVLEAPFSTLGDDDYLKNPVHMVERTGRMLRRRLVGADAPNDFPILDELRAEGATDYLVHPLPFSDGRNHAVSWTTNASDGFSDAHVAALTAIARPLARIAEIYALRRTAETLLDTYVGREAGERILRGRIRRGDTESIHAAILLADLRGFTPLAHRVAGDRLIHLLNEFFDCLVEPIHDHGGEVLKYMGDGLLAIFPVGAAANQGEPTQQMVCDLAVRAAIKARGNIDARNDRARQADDIRIRFGLAMHVGQVLYGNIGSSGRLDFTTIGPAVNLVARLDKLAGDLAEPIIVSSDFRQTCGLPFRSLGRFELRGFSESQEVFRPDCDSTVV